MSVTTLLQTPNLGPMTDLTQDMKVSHHTYSSHDNNVDVNADDTDSISDTASETMSWIDDETTEEELYGAFYNAPIESVQLVQMLFSNDGQSCLGVSRACCQLETPGLMTPEELIPIIKCQTTNGFRLLSVLRFCLEVDSSKIDEFVMTPHTISNPLTKLEEVTYTSVITFPESVKALESTATIFVLYMRKPSRHDSGSIHRHRQTRVAGRKTAPTSTTTSHASNRTNNRASNRANNRANNRTRRRSVSFT